MRLFIAIELPAPVRRHLAVLAASLRESLDRASRPVPISWTRESNLHVTLKFLGEVPDERVTEVCDALAHVEYWPPALRLYPEALDAFPSRNVIRVLHARVAGEIDRLAALHAAIAVQCEQLGFPRENRRFHAHVTLARPRVPLRGAWETLQESARDAWPGPAFEARQFSLVQSQLNPRGSVYTPLAHLPRTC